jgi:hypothetical protein
MANGTAQNAKAKTKKSPKRVLALPDLEQTQSAVLNTLTSKSGQPRLALNRTVVLRYRIYLEERHLAPTTINLRLAVVRRVAYEAADSGLLSPEPVAGIRHAKSVRRIGVSVGNWLTVDQSQESVIQVERTKAGHIRTIPIPT